MKYLEHFHHRQATPQYIPNVGEGYGLRHQENNHEFGVAEAFHRAQAPSPAQQPVVFHNGQYRRVPRFTGGSGPDDWRIVDQPYVANPPAGNFAGK